MACLFFFVKNKVVFITKKIGKDFCISNVFLGILLTINYGYIIINVIHNYC